MAFDPARAKALFLEASELAAAERVPFLDGECRADAGLRARVEALLAADVEPRPNSGHDAGAVKTSAVPSADRAGAVIDGKYKLLEVIGAGGMGDVWLAQQSEPVKRKVAVKLIKLGMDSRQVLGRFDAERQALAVMDHPNIAKVLDAGLAPDGRPFFVMELVKGTPITDFCDANKLGVRERLDLFIPVCQAIQHAHQKGIIHRDIKPSNVMIALYDDRPVPKVIDFGVAKAIGGALTELTLETGFGGVVGTPHYMSPEQATLNNLDVDTRSDVYSLGVLLYELLTGSPPFGKEELERKGMLEVLRVVREDEPPKPSTKLSTAAALPDISANRSAEPKKLTALLRSELDWIVLKSLEKDRVRRYETANGLAADVQRYLAGEPALAHPPSAAYRTSKFVRKHRAQVVAASVVAATLVLGMAGTAWQARRANQQRDLALAAGRNEARQRQAAETERLAAESARRLAESQRDKAEKIAAFTGDILDGASPSVARGHDSAMLKEMMDVAAARIERGELKSSPEAELRLRQTIGLTYSLLGLYPEAARMLEPALGLSRALHPDDDIETVRTLDRLAYLLLEHGDLGRAELLQRESLAMLRRMSPRGGVDLANTLSSTAQVLRARGDLAGAESLYRESLATWARAFPDDKPEKAITLSGLATVLRLRGDLAGAEASARESLAMSRRLFPGDHPDVLDSLNSLSSILQARGDFAGAEPVGREALAMSKRLFPGDHPKVATVMNTLAMALYGRRDAGAAEPLLRESLAMDRRLFPSDNAVEATTIHNLASLLRDQGKPAEAEPLFREALAMRRRLFPGDNPDVAGSIASLADLLYRRGDLAGAEPLCRESLEMSRRLSPGDGMGLVSLLNRLGYVLRDRGDLAGAESLMRESAEMTKRLFPGGNISVGINLTNLAVVLKARGNMAGAEAVFREALAVLEHLYPGDHTGVAYVLTNLASILQDRGDLAGAEPLARRALAMKRHLYPGDDRDVVSGLTDLSSLLLLRGNAAEAESSAREGLAMCERLGGKGPVSATNVRLTLGRALTALGRFPDAETELLESERLLVAATAVSPSRRKASVDAIVALYESWHKSDPAKGYDAKAAEWKNKLAPASPATRRMP